MYPMLRAMLAVAASGGGDPGSGTPTWTGTLTIASGKVSSNVAGFPVMVDLADLPSGFWGAVAAGGADLRIKQGASYLPLDVVAIDIGAETGLAFFRADLLAASDNVFTVEAGSGDPAPAATALTGRNAVWSGFHRMWAFQEPWVDRTGQGAGAIVFREPDYALTVASTSAALTTHVQGVQWDGTYYYVTAETSPPSLIKYDAAFNVVATNADVITAAGATGTSQIGALALHAGALYFFITDIDGDTPRYLVKFSATDLSFIDKVDMTALGAYGSAVAYNPDDGYLWVTNYWDGGGDIKRLTTAGVEVDTITLSRPIPNVQGITCSDGFIYLSTAADSVWQLDQDGVVRRMVYSVNSTMQGMGTKGGNLLLVFDNAIRELQWPTVSGSRVDGWLNLNGALGHARCYGLTKYGTWTVGASAAIAAKGSNRPVASYTDADTGGDSTREALGTNATADRWGMWNSTDGWLTGGSSPTVDQVYRLHMMKNGTTDRTVWINGALAATDAGTAARPTSVGDCLYIGASHSGTISYTGIINYVYLYPGTLSAAWIAAEDASWRTPGSFYAIT